MVEAGSSVAGADEDAPDEGPVDARGAADPDAPELGADDGTEDDEAAAPAAPRR